MNPNSFRFENPAWQAAHRATAIPAGQRLGRDRWLYFSLSASFLLVSLVGFLPSYFIKVSNHTFALPPILHIHATLFFAWGLLNVLQTWWVATGRTYNHRNWGLLGIALATAMAISIILMMITAIKAADARGMPASLAVRHFQVSNLAGVIKFCLFFAAAIVCVHRKEIHKRLIVVANCTLLGAPIGRMVMMGLGDRVAHGPPPAYAMLLIISLAYLPVLVGVMHDLRLGRRPHPAYVVGLLLGWGTAFLTPMLSGSAVGMALMSRISGLLG